MMPPPTPRAPLLERMLAALLLAAATGIVLLRAAQADFSWILWGDRDLVRMIGMGTDWPTSGAELSYGVGARLPGGAWHVLLAIPFQLRGEAADAWMFLFVLDALAGLLLAASLRRGLGPLPAAAAAAVYLAPSAARVALGWLWNPTMVPPFATLAQVLLLVALVGGRGWAWAGWGWAMAIGGHGHFTSLAWMIWVLLGLLALRGRDTLRAAPWILLGAGITYVPYLLDEATSGWPNTLALTGQSTVRTVTQGSGLVFQPAEIAESARMLLPSVPNRGGVAWAGWLGPVAVGALAAVGLLRSGHGPEPVRTLLRVQALALAANLLAPALDSQVEVETRYLVIALPAVATLAAAGVAALLQASAPAGRQGLAVLAAVLLALPLGLDAYDRRLGVVHDTTYQWSGRAAAIAALRERTGWSHAELAGRLFFAQRNDGRWTFGQPDPMEWLLAKDGDTFPGSLAPPCAAVFANASDAERGDEALLAHLLALPADQVRITERIPVHEHLEAVLYDPGRARCATMSTDRYVDTPVEALARPGHAEAASGQPWTLPAPEGTLRRAVAIDPPGDGTYRRLVVVLDVRPGPDRLDLVLHSNQLRGRAYNGGWYESALVSRPRVRFTPRDGGPPVEVVVEDGPVGLNGIVPPLASQAPPLPTGAWSVDLVLEVHDLPDGHGDWPFAPGPAHTVEVRIADDLRAP